jgi:hypothetical protein
MNIVFYCRGHNIVRLSERHSPQAGINLSIIVGTESAIIYGLGGKE